MSGSSTVAGPLLPLPPNPPGGAGLDAFMQIFVSQVTGIAGNLVFPRWQPGGNPPQPPASTNWCAMGTTAEHRIGYAEQTFDPTADGDTGQLTLQRFVNTEFTASFYGPNCMENATVFADAFHLSQNRALLLPYAIGYTTSGDAVRVPEFVNEQWVDRADVTITLARTVSRQYDIKGIIAAPGLVTDSPVSVDFNATLEE
jgi:hypothetical protein